LISELGGISSAYCVGEHTNFLDCFVEGVLNSLDTNWAQDFGDLCSEEGFRSPQMPLGRLSDHSAGMTRGKPFSI